MRLQQEERNPVQAHAQGGHHAHPWGSIDPAAYAWTSNEFEGEGALRVPAWPARFIVLAVIVVIAAFPQIATWLPTLGTELAK